VQQHRLKNLIVIYQVNVANILCEKGEVSAAAALLEQAVQTAQAQTNHGITIGFLQELGDVCLLLDIAKAETYYELGHRLAVQQLLDQNIRGFQLGLAIVAAEQGNIPLMKAYYRQCFTNIPLPLIFESWLTFSLGLLHIACLACENKQI